MICGCANKTTTEQTEIFTQPYHFKTKEHSVNILKTTEIAFLVHSPSRITES